MNDKEHRHIAAAELEKNLVVLAGAGTGKTTLLIDRLTRLIIGKEIPVEKIVALTFTKKAAEEMRERLEARLRAIVAEGQEKPAALAKKAIDDIPKSQIGTIHSFAGHLLRLYPLQSGVDPRFREDQGVVGETVFESVWSEWIASELSAHATHGAEWTALLQRILLSELREMAWTLVSPMVDLKSLEAAPGLSTLFASDADALAALREKYPLPARAPAFLPALDALNTIFTLLRAGKPAPPAMLDLLDPLDKPPKDWAEAKAALRQLKKSALAFGMVDEDLFRRIYARLLPVVELVRRELTRRGAVSFEGLLVFARNLLRDHVDVRASLKKRFATFLIDEFQDTDPLQGEILFYLAERLESSASRWQDVRLEPGRLFVVGDPKQSIYRFRGADIAAFEAFEDHMVRQGAIQATLSVNFRSDERILNFVNAIFPSHMVEEKYVQPAYVALEAADRPDGKREADPVWVVRTVKQAGAKLKAEERRIAEAQIIADWIEAQVKTGRKYGDVAVLLRSANAFEEYLEVFRRRGIPYLAEGEKTFYRTGEALDFLNLLSIVADPNDTLALVGVLRSPVGGLTDKEILDLKTAGGLSIRRRPPVHADKIGRLFETLARLSIDAHEMPLPNIIQNVVRKTWALETASSSPYGEQAVANLFKIGRLADQWGRQDPMTLKEFVRRFDRYRDDERDEGENPLADVKYDAVKVLTIHKAKGLEFPVVMLPNLSAARRGGLEKRKILRDWGSGLTGLRLEKGGNTNAAMALVERQEEKREAAEEVRVFYVAATRAKSQLICFVDGGEKSGRFSEVVNSAGDLPGVRYEEIEETPVIEHGGPTPAFTPGAHWNAETLAARINERAAALPALLREKRLMSPTSLLSEPEKRRIVQDEDELMPRETAILIGHLTHKVLEEWDFSAPASKHAALLKKGVARAGKLFEMSPMDPATPEILGEVEALIERFLSSAVYKKIAAGKIIGKELPFIYPGMRGFIDLLYESEGKLIIADYKTNRVDGANRKELVEHYRLQGDAYKDAIRRTLGRYAEFELIFLRDL